ncbi:trans-aconitate 2-methyltransferase [Emericellopsis atlantica]|uniref:Trans-aconitate 2-methyltransferase n=1 Tax=Emericellopsis atlantica TaxID=2614577 RepID=A0A9P7ZSQ7_9HYPO|nr:trans-aconitate 2-methyltransferase [Emericellopsis atlantica]KAG9257619.1 trans-aconitate 2-methyltransferase [Emericellopsis atlantica]
MSHLLRSSIAQLGRKTASRAMSSSSPAAADTWSANQYSKFLGERTQPSRDLLARVPLAQPRRIIDLGCGPGNSTAVVAARYPTADLAGVDTSQDMLRKARETLPGVPFDLADVTTFQPPGPVDLYFSNAVFQWLPNGTRLEVLQRLVSHLAPGGVLAFQVPFNMTEPSHRAMADVAHAPGTPWEDTMRRAGIKRDQFPAPIELYDGLQPLCADVQIWCTTYFHVLENHEAIVEWVRGTGLAPYLTVLDDAQREGYLAAYLERVKEAYPAQADGKVMLPYPRLFVVATKSGA